MTHLITLCNQVQVVNAKGLAGSTGLGLSHHQREWTEWFRELEDLELVKGV